MIVLSQIISALVICKYKKMAFRFSLIFFLTLLNYYSYSQHWLGISSSNFAGTNGIYLNPSSIVDSRFKVYLNVGGNDFFLMNDYLRYNAPYSTFSILTNTVSSKYRNERGLIIWKEDFYKENLNGKPKNINVGGDIRGPSILYSSKNRKFAYGISTRGRYQLDLTNVTEQTARIIRFGTDPVEFQNELYLDQKANLSTNGFLEIAGTFGAVLRDDEEDFWKAGINVKRLIGMFNTHANLQSADYSVLPLIIPPEREIIFAPYLKSVYGFTSEEATKFRLTPSWLFGNAPAGSGWGIDLGISYEYRPEIRKYKLASAKAGERYNDPKKNKYKFRISAALNDIGSIRYKNPALVSQYDIERSNVTFSYVQFDGKGNPTGATGAVNKTLNLRANENFSPYTVILPTTVNISLDYLYKDNFYVNAIWIQGLTKSGYLNISPQSVLAVIPRYERKWLEVSMPISVIDNYSTVAVGLGLRAGPVILGTDHLGGLFNIGHARGLDLYFGLYAPLFHKKPASPNPCYVQPDLNKKKKFFFF